VCCLLGHQITQHGGISESNSRVDLPFAVLQAETHFARSHVCVNINFFNGSKVALDRGRREAVDRVASIRAHNPLLRMLPGKEGLPGGGRSGKGDWIFLEAPPHAFNKTSAADPPLGVGMAVV